MEAGYRRVMTSNSPPTEDPTPTLDLPEPANENDLSGPREPDVDEPTIDHNELTDDD